MSIEHDAFEREVGVAPPALQSEKNHGLIYIAGTWILDLEIQEVSNEADLEKLDKNF